MLHVFFLCNYFWQQMIGRVSSQWLPVFASRGYKDSLSLLLFFGPLLDLLQRQATITAWHAVQEFLQFLHQQFLFGVYVGANLSNISLYERNLFLSTAQTEIIWLILRKIIHENVPYQIFSNQDSSHLSSLLLGRTGNMRLVCVVWTVESQWRFGQTGSISPDWRGDSPGGTGDCDTIFSITCSYNVHSCPRPSSHQQLSSLGLLHIEPRNIKNEQRKERRREGE